MSLPTLRNGFMQQARQFRRLGRGGGDLRIGLAFRTDEFPPDLLQEAMGTLDSWGFIGPEGEPIRRISAAATEPPELTRLLHETIRKVGNDIEHLRFNTAISQMMVFSNALQKAPAVTRATALAFLQVLAPFAPHIAEGIVVTAAVPSRRSFARPGRISTLPDLP